MQGEGSKGKGNKGGKGEVVGNAEKKYTRECHYCSKAGHSVADCRKKKREEKGTRKAAAVNRSASASSTPATHAAAQTPIATTNRSN